MCWKLKEVIITKANGQKAVFEPYKVESTCVRAGATKEEARKILERIHPKLYPGITTREIYRLVLHFLSDGVNQAVKHRYRLKESIMRMGPAGFPFETFVGRVLEHYGYRVLSIGAKMQGHCVQHEVDLILESSQDDRKWLVECKYHNMPGRYTGLKESLYTHARFLDLSDMVDREMLACNTKVSDEVVTYAGCIKQRILSWRYPPQNGLERLVEDKNLYPATILGLSRREIEMFSRQRLMIAKDLLDVDINDFVRKTGISPKRILSLQKLVNQIIG